MINLSIQQSNFINGMLLLDPIGIEQMDRDMGDANIEKLIEYIPTEIDGKIRALSEVYNSLIWENQASFELARALVIEANRNGIFNLNSSISSDGRLLIYNEVSQGTFRNLLIDEDGDVSFIEIDNSSGESQSEFFDSDEALNLKELVQKLS